jgi:hypothetical protein
VSASRVCFSCLLLVSAFSRVRFAHLPRRSNSCPHPWQVVACRLQEYLAGLLRNTNSCPHPGETPTAAQESTRNTVLRHGCLHTYFTI